MNNTEAVVFTDGSYRKISSEEAVVCSNYILVNGKSFIYIYNYNDVINNLLKFISTVPVDSNEYIRDLTNNLMMLTNMSSIVAELMGLMMALIYALNNPELKKMTIYYDNKYLPYCFNYFNNSAVVSLAKNVPNYILRIILEMIKRNMSTEVSMIHSRAHVLKKPITTSEKYDKFIFGHLNLEELVEYTKILYGEKDWEKAFPSMGNIIADEACTRYIRSYYNIDDLSELELIEKSQIAAEHSQHFIKAGYYEEEEADDIGY